MGGERPHEAPVEEDQRLIAEGAAHPVVAGQAPHHPHPPPGLSLLEEAPPVSSGAPEMVQGARIRGRWGRDLLCPPPGVAGVPAGVLLSWERCRGRRRPRSPWRGW